ncbi:MAG: DUF5667 domain-containing protein [Patescibacteria group bacterium]|jgi:hypothetical protein
MPIINHDNLIQEISILGKDAKLSLTQRQAIRDRLFKKIGQTTLIDAVQTQTEVEDLVMPLPSLRRLFTPRRVVLSIPATAGMVAAVFVATFATGAMAQTAQPGDPLFGVKKVFETVQVALATNPSARAAVKLAIVNDRLRALENADTTQVAVILAESQKALTSAQTTLSTLPADKDLNTKLKTLIESQKTVLATLAKGDVSTDDTKKTLLAMRDQLDKIIAPVGTVTPITDTEKPAVVDTTPTQGFVTLYGSIGSYSAKPTLMVGDKRYYLVGATINLISYMGFERAAVSGVLNGDTITLSKLTINGQTIWEAPSLNNNPVDNNLPRVEGDQNSSPR